VATRLAAVVHRPEADRRAAVAAAAARSTAAVVVGGGVAVETVGARESKEEWSWRTRVESSGDRFCGRGEGDGE
jgi:regulator of protease activity HflC (stomatin/prohibitin superfamily)